MHYRGIWNIFALAGGGLLHVAMAIAGIFAAQTSESGIASMGRRCGDSLHDGLDGTVFAVFDYLHVCLLHCVLSYLGMLQQSIPRDNSRTLNSCKLKVFTCA